MRRFLVTSAVAAVVTAALVPGSGLGSETIASRAAATATSGPQLGTAVALSADGTTAIVGAPYVAGAKGAAYVFHASDAGAWSSTAIPTATLMSTSEPAKNVLFGFSVALSADGTTAFVGAPGAGGGTGAIYAFHVAAEDEWASSSTPAATLTVSQDLLLGYAIAVSPDGTTLVAGAPFYNSFAGGAYVFHVFSEDAWASTSTPTAILDNESESPDDVTAGTAVAISGDGTTALVADSGNPDGGGAWVYRVPAEGSWTSRSTPKAILTDAHSGPNDDLGTAVALSGDGTVALLGTPGATSSTGSADVFHASAEAAWASTSTPTATLTNAGGSANASLGEDVALSTDGTTALVTAPGVGTQRGAAYIFRASGEGAWASSSAPAATVTRSGAVAKDVLGVGALSADGSTALLGAPGVRFATGAAYAFHVAAASAWATSSAPTAILTNAALYACVVPKLRNLTLRAAKSALTARSCRLGTVSRVDSPLKRGRVVSQGRKPGARFAVGTKVGVKLAK